MSVPVLFRLRLLQAWRWLKSIGIIVLLLLAFVSIPFSLQLGYFLLHLSFFEALIAGASIISLIHFGRKDLTFLSLHTDTPAQMKKILWGDYTLALCPLWVFATIGGSWAGLGGVVLSTLFSWVLPLKTTPLSGRYNKLKLTWIPLSLFELRSMLRRRWPYFLLFYLAGYFGFFHIAFYILSVIICGALIGSAFEWLEPPSLIHWEKGFLWKKIKINSLFVHAFFLPVYGIGLGFNLPDYIIIIAGILFFQLLLIFSITYKYAIYRPQMRRAPQNVVHALYFVFLLIPGFQLVCIMMCIWYFRKAKQRMNYFWSDHYNFI